MSRNLGMIKGGSFDCAGNRITSLEGCPKHVDRSFDCSYNNLLSLEGAPEFVGGDFWCQKNTRQFRESEVRKVCNVRGTVYVY